MLPAIWRTTTIFVLLKGKKKNNKSGSSWRPQSELPIIILGEEVPSDWVQIAMLPNVYFLQGSPLLLFDLERVNCLLFWLSILRFSEGLQSGETAEGFRLLFLCRNSGRFTVELWS